MNAAVATSKYLSVYVSNLIEPGKIYFEKWAST